ncbi:cysteine-rich venom protein-like [Manis pentadactyla]|uniref:cysteine-rich venom protein-like n=1 Tax=Manis pentadactyla TaxID=143292 RepID=UPI00187511AC|nr:cysteine-rich venom protein-like [Manis pentadactyla]KAI5140529.1 Cysteine-Rich Secretory Protein 2 [Manis pentadactyla]
MCISLWTQDILSFLFLLISETMLLVGICLVVLLQQAAGMSDGTVLSLSTHHPSVQKEIVNKHNALRRMVNPTASNMLKMSWNRETAKNAEKWAKKCTLSHSPPSERKISFTGCGENLFMSSNPTSWTDAIQYLYNEVGNFTYGFGRTRADAVVGHYTQIVWATSHQLGCAFAYCPEKKLRYYYVCQYCPAGNFVEFMKTPYKRGKPCGACPDHCDNGLCTNPCMHVNKYGNCDDLVQIQGCNTKAMKENCPATCKCPSEIRLKPLQSDVCPQK